MALSSKPSGENLEFNEVFNELLTNEGRAVASTHNHVEKSKSNFKYLFIFVVLSQIILTILCTFVFCTIVAIISIRFFNLSKLFFF